jgi:predicted XRE-type DNA-binding protein
MKRKTENRLSSGNIFVDSGLPNADEHSIKAKLVMKIGALLRARELKQIEAAEFFGVKQPDISKMLRGDFRQFSVERLMRYFGSDFLSIDSNAVQLECAFTVTPQLCRTDF